MSDRFTIEVRNLLDCSVELVGEDLLLQGYDAIAAAVESAGDTYEWKVSKWSEVFSNDFSARKLDARVTGGSVVTGVIWIEGAEKCFRTVLSIVRGFVASDSYDHRRYAFLEIEKRGPKEGDWIVYGTKGPPKRSSAGADPEEPSGKPDFRGDGRDTSFYEPLIIGERRSEDAPGKPGVVEYEVEFFDFDFLAEVLGAEGGVEIGGVLMGEAMEEEMEKKKLVKVTEGVYAGGYFDNHDSDTVTFYFNALEDAMRVAGYFAPIFKDRKKLRRFLSAYHLDTGAE